MPDDRTPAREDGSEAERLAARLREAERRADRAIRRMQAVASAASGIVGARGLQALQEVLRGACAQVIEFDAFVFALYDEDSDALSFLRIEDAGVIVEPHEGIPLSGTPAERVIRDRRSLVTGRADDPGSRGSRIIGTGRPAESVVRTPILAGRRVLGILSIQSYTPALYSAEDVEVLESVAALAATALLNIRSLNERRRAEAELRESEERFRQLAENVDQVFVLYDEASEEVLYVSPAYERLWGRSRESLYAEPASWKDSIHPEDRALVMSSEHQLGEVRRDLEYRIVRPDGEVRWVRDRAFPVRSSAAIGPRSATIAEDITEEKAARGSLRESEVSYRSLFDSVSELVYVQDLEGRFLNVNEAVMQRYGYGREELIGVTPEILVDADRTDMSMVVDRFRRAAEGEPQRFDFWARTRRGESFPKEVSLSRGRYFGRDVVIAVARDISERKDAEAKLAAAEAHYRRLVENAPYSIFALDRRGCFTELSPATGDIIGFAPATLIGKPLAALVVPEDLPKAQESVRSKLAGEVETGDVEFRIMHASGSERLIHVRSTPIREAGEIVGVHGIARDITEERRSQEQTRMLAAALENLEEGVSIVRADGRLIYANEAHGRLLGYDPRARPLPSASDMVIGGEELQETLRRVIGRGKWIGRANLRRMDDGRIVPMELIHGAIDWGDGEPLLFTITRDISEEIEEEQRLRRAERLASFGTLVGGVAHELNNPLQAIRSFAELLVSEVEEQQATDDLLTIQREAARAAKIVSDLRLLARSTQDEVAEKRPIDLNEVVRHVLNTRKYSLETRNIEIIADLAPALPTVLADRAQMEQVLVNLVVNAEQAVESTPGDRTITLRTRTGGDGVSVEVIDSGPGIPSQDLERIFDPFWTTKAPGEGTGLGLSLAHSIITDHGGVIDVESDPRHGAVFRLHLPISADPAPPADAADVADAAEDAHLPHEPLRILVVDDESSIRQVLARSLRRRGHEVDVAEEGEEALRLLRAATETGGAAYDVILSDLRMPGLGGGELFDKLREMGEGLERRVVFMTGDAVGADAGRILDALSAPVIFKPMSLDYVARRIEQHADAVSG